MKKPTKNKQQCTGFVATGILIAGFLMVGMVSQARAQAPGSVLYLETNMQDALVYIDSVMVGRAENGYFQLPEGARSLELIPSFSDAWSIRPLSYPLEHRLGDTLRVELNFAYHYYLNSVPFDAEVYHETLEDQEFLGLTPFVFESAGPLSGELVFVSDGYKTQRIEPGERIWNEHSLVLDLTEQQFEDRFASQRRERRLSWLDYTIAGATLASGLLAVRYKMEADKRYERYAENGDPLLRPPVRRMDTYAGLALGSMQVGLGYLAVRLVINKK